MKPQLLLKSFIGSLCMLAVVGVAQVQVRSAAPTVNLVPPQPTGTITGHVYCADTQRPARFADVQLLRQADPGGQGQRGNGQMYQPMGRARTALDGSFAITGVQAGDYYVTATMTGYVSPAAVARMTRSPIAGVPFTHVDAGRSADVVISMTRGAVVAGRVLYDDGSPVPGVMVRVRPVAGSGVSALPNIFNAFGGGGFGGDIGSEDTDDRGAFRLVGVPPGSYNVMTTVATETTSHGTANRANFRGPEPMLNVYAPATMRASAARVVEIKGGETVDGIDVQVALNGLHSVQGSVESKADGHMLNAGNVSLIDSADPSLTRNAVIDSDGTFRVEYLPAGNYTLTVRGEDRLQDANGRPSGGKRYQVGTQAVTVGDSDVRADPVQLDEVQTAASSSGTSAK